MISGVRGYSFRPYPGRIEHLGKTQTPEDLADTSDIRGGRRLRFKRINGALGGATALQPDQRDVVFGRPDSSRIGRRFRGGQATHTVQDGSW